MGDNPGDEPQVVQPLHLSSVFSIADAGKPATGIPAVEIALDHILNNGPEEAMLLLETSLVFRQEMVKIMGQHSIKDRPLGMPGTIHSRYSGRMASRNGPSSQVRWFEADPNFDNLRSDARFPKMMEKARVEARKIGKLIPRG
jgi:hypothetical protein